jgi:CubicO group peptidase (beta-lactamase class C family)
MRADVHWAFSTLLIIALAPEVSAERSRLEWRRVANQVPHWTRRPLRSQPKNCASTAALIDTLAPEVLNAFNVSGMSVGLICNHTVAVAKGFGLADRAKQTPASASTRYQIASNTKLFTAMLLLILADEGRLDLDQPVRAVNPDFVFKDVYGAEAITPRDLLSHRTGLPRHDRVTFASSSRRAMMSAVQFLPLDKPVRYQPGEYNNMMLVAAGVAAEHAASEQWEDLIESRIFEPLNLSESYANLSTAMATAPSGSLALPYAHVDGVFEPIERDLADVGAPCGGILSTVNDMLKWQAVHLRQARSACNYTEGHPRPPHVHCRSGASAAVSPAPPSGSAATLVRDETWEQLLHSNSIFPALTLFGGYSLGLWVEPWSEGEVLLHHEGDLSGMASLQMMLPFRGHSIVILTNENESPARFALGLALLDHLLGLEAPSPSWNERFLDVLAERAAEAAAEDSAVRRKISGTPPGGRTPRFQLPAYTGSFIHPAYGNATIGLLAVQTTSREQRQLSGTHGLQLCGAPALWSAGNGKPATPACAPLLHVYYETFALGARSVDEVDAETLMLSFYANGDGEVVRFEAPVEPMVPPLPFARA